MADAFQIVTDKILNLLQLGEIPWHRPWCSVEGGAFNRISGKQYSLQDDKSKRMIVFSASQAEKAVNYVLK